MIESRCGVRCDICERKKDVKCLGCINMSKPFWGGECHVKSCSEQRGYNHCGQCNEFPCDTLSNMGKAEGYDPLLKIEQCKKWLIG
ncbi:MAG: DUF3795 domain-containing protein [Anaeromicrobium sp.]|uniref:DUF3795 domain-containing protein n=1 Tax=Anaeromicrobium sp. TaxID=1929132 RepID=UPI0025CEDEA8|nr:DUF3795 domain-containing protein [Anaeromicrobium sp.]MCT4595874.1 DUF3795 domain-containing protein [Anaeromicrobium sp.]